MSKTSLDFGKLLRTSWDIVKSRPYLWILGILGGSGSSFPSFNGGGSGWDMDKDDIKETFKSFNLGDVAGEATSKLDSISDITIVYIIISAVVLLLLVMIFGILFRGGLIQSIKDIAEKKDNNFYLAWAAGKKVFWPLFGLQWLLVLAFIILMIPLGGIILLIDLSSAGPGAALAGEVLGIVLLVFWVIVVVALAILISLAYPYIERSLVLEKLGIRESIRQGVRFFRAHWIDALIVVLIGIAISFAWVIALVLALIIIGVIAGILIFGLYTLTPAAGIAAGIIVGILALTVLIIAVGAFNAYISTLYTGAYLALQTRTKTV